MAALACAMGPAVAHGAPDANEPNDTPSVATALAPMTAPRATLAGASDTDWYAVRFDTADWDGHSGQYVAVTGQRISAGCGASALTTTMYADGVAQGTRTVDEGQTFSTLFTLFRPSPDTRYTFRVMIEPDSGCTDDLAYSLRAVPYVPVTGAELVRHHGDQAACQAYRANVNRTTTDIKRARSRHRTITKLNAKLKRLKAKVKAACG